MRPKRSTFAERLGQLIAEHRAGPGWSQAELAAWLGVTQTVISQWERGVTQPTADRFVAIVAHLGITQDELDELAGLVAA